MSRHIPCGRVRILLMLMICKNYGAVEKTRTSTAFRPQRPQRCASTSSATTARHEIGSKEPRCRWQGAAPSKGLGSAQSAPPSRMGTVLNALFTMRAATR